MIKLKNKFKNPSQNTKIERRRIAIQIGGEATFPKTIPLSLTPRLDNW